MLDSIEETPVQILEVKPRGTDAEASITLAVSAEASRALLVALSEQLDRRRAAPLEGAQDVRELRQATELVETIDALVAAEAHAVVRLSPEELQSCLLELTNYADRMDIDVYQPPDLRQRLQVIARVIPVLWDANAGSATPPLADQIFQ